MISRWPMFLRGVLLIVVWALATPIATASGPVALHGTLTVLATGLGSPDDLAVSADDTIYVSDMRVNRVAQLKAEGVLTIVSPAINEPEGIVPWPDGTLIVVEQATNYLYRLDPVHQTMTVFYKVGNRTHNPGIDGLSRDPLTGDLLIPDAPTGRILRLSADGQDLRITATGFRRPTSVAMATDGTLFVCDEYGGAIYRVTPTGKTTLLTTIPLPDDVIVDTSGNLIVNSLQGVIWRIDLTTKQATPLVIGLQAPHGIALDSKGNLIIADATLNQIFRLVMTS